jgi:hypothetical protein
LDLMRAWHCGLMALLAGCVNLSAPPELNRKVVDAVATDDDAASLPADGPDEDAGVDAGDDVPAPIIDADTPADTLPDDAALIPDAPPEPDATEPDAPLVVNGRPCSVASQCQSGFCVDGVCCSGECKGVCQACNVSGSAGTCVPVSAGQDPDNECPQDPVSTCGRDGTCNGQGACSRYKEGTECAPGGCTGSDEHAASTCNGAGVCAPGKTVSCSPHMCMNGSCATSCRQQTECLAGFFCDGSACQPRRAAGQTCAMGFECASGSCTDKVCCNSPCGEACHSCALPGSLGTCIAAPAGQDPRAECPAEAASTCGRAGACDGNGGCRLHPATTACGAGPSCTANIETAASACNGLGVCLPGAMRDCGAFRCNGAACATSCTTAAQCKPGYACTAGACLPLPTATLYWKLDEPTATTTAADSSGHGFNGTYVGSGGTPTQSAMVPPLGFPDAFSHAFVRAKRNAVQLANMPAAIKPASDITVSVWYRATDIDTGPSGSMAGSELVSAGDNYLIRLHMGDVEVSKRTSAGHTMCLGVVSNHLDGKWHHVAGQWTATGMNVYFDGVQKMTCANSAPILYDRGTDLFVGRHGNDTTNAAIYDFEGNIDDVRIYAQTLSPTEIAALAAGN